MAGKFTLKTTTYAAGGALVLALGAGSALSADQNPFAYTELSSGYQLAENTVEARCGSNKDNDKDAEQGKTKESSCGANKKEVKEAQCGEAKCGGARDSGSGK